MHAKAVFTNIKSATELWKLKFKCNITYWSNLLLRIIRIIAHDNEVIMNAYVAIDC